MMNQTDNRETDNTQTLTEDLAVSTDLTVEGETPAEVKGGVLIGLLLPAVQKIK